VSAWSQTPFNQGVNLTSWFQAGAPNQIQFTKFTRKDFENIKSLGCDVIRLPINLHAMTNGAPEYVLDPLFLSYLDQAVNWAEELEIHIILDNHTFDPATDTDPSVGTILVKVWTQMADHFNNRSNFVYYEILNEPHGISDQLWGSIQQTAIDAIRSKDTNHTIVVGPADWNSYHKLSAMPVYTDPNLLYTFHFYDPFILTHQGASWTDPSMVPLAGVPFPYQAASMPAVPASLRGTWIENLMNNYAVDGTAAKVKQLIDIAVNFKNQRNVPIFCGEFGVYIPNSIPTDRVTWYKVVRDYMQEKQIPWTMWDYTGGFGVFTKNSNELFDYDLNVPLLEALQFTIPPQKIYPSGPRTTGLTLYDDYLGEGIFESSSTTGSGALNYYWDTNPQAGEHAIFWTGASQYNNIGFDFKPNLNLSLLPENDYQLEFWVMGNTPGVKFDIRFVDTKTSDTDHPWRMGKTIDNSFALWDDLWHKVTIPLSQLEEKGSWDNAWFNPEGKFDWKAVDRFEIVAEHQSLNGITLAFDELKLTGEEITIATGVSETRNYHNLELYPNPVIDRLNLEFQVTEQEGVSLEIYNLLGQKIKTIVEGPLHPGHHMVRWDVSDDGGRTVGKGLYLIYLKSSMGSFFEKVVVTN
jgi:endoglucanase